MTIDELWLQDAGPIKSRPAPRDPAASGVSTLALGSITATTAIFSGVVRGVKWLERRP